MLLGVSRQSVSKWEAERAYPEMDKLLALCDLFGCTLDDLVTGDMTGREVDGAVRMPQTGVPQDVTGYDEAMRSFAGRAALGFALPFAVVAAALPLWGLAFASDIDLWSFVGGGGACERRGLPRPRVAGLLKAQGLSSGASFRRGLLHGRAEGARARGVGDGGGDGHRMFSGGMRGGRARAENGVACGSGGPAGRGAGDPLYRPQPSHGEALRPGSLQPLVASGS